MRCWGDAPLRPSFGDVVTELRTCLWERERAQAAPPPSHARGPSGGSHNGSSGELIPRPGDGSGFGNRPRSDTRERSARLLRSAQNYSAGTAGAENTDTDDDDASSRGGGQWRRRVDSGSSMGSGSPRDPSSFLPEFHRPLLPPTSVGGGRLAGDARLGPLGPRAMSTPHGWAPTLGSTAASSNAESGASGSGMGSGVGRGGASRPTPSADLLRFYNQPGTPTAGARKGAAPVFFRQHSNSNASVSSSSDDEGRSSPRQGLVAATSTVRTSPDITRMRF